MISLFNKIKHRRYGTVRTISNLATTKRIIYPNKKPNKYDRNIPREHMAYWWSRFQYAFQMWFKDTLHKAPTGYVAKKDQCDDYYMGIIRELIQAAPSYTISYAEKELCVPYSERSNKNYRGYMELCTTRDAFAKRCSSKLKDYCYRERFYKGPLSAASNSIAALEVRKINRKIEEYVQNLFDGSVEEYINYMKKYESIPTERARPSYD